MYYISLTGITGKKKAVPADVGKNLKKLRKITKKPVCVGFGVTSPGQARAIARYADGIVIGSEAIRVINKAGSQAKAETALKKFVRSIRRGLDS